MIINIDLPDLKLKKLKLEDETLYYNGYRLELWNSNLNSVIEQATLAQELFFQEEFDITTNVIKEAGLNENDVVYELAQILFEDISKAYAVHQYTNARFDEIKEDIINNNPLNYEYNNKTFLAYTEHELFTEATEIRMTYYEGIDYSDIIDSDVATYANYIDFEKLIPILKNIMGDLDEKIDYMAWDSDPIKFTNTYMQHFNDLGEILEENDLLDLDAIAEDDMADFSYAIEEIESVTSCDFIGKFDIKSFPSIYLFEEA